MPLSTPLHISLLVHYNGILTEWPNRGYPAVEEYIGHLLKARLIRRRKPEEREAYAKQWGIVTAEFRTTRKGEKLVEEFCKVLASEYTLKVVRSIYKKHAPKKD